MMSKEKSLRIPMNAVIGIVEASSKIHKKYFRKWGPGAGDEKSAKEVVSRVDREAEEFLKSKLLKLVAGSSFYGEETGRTGTGEFLWIVDPLDGTGNYLSGLDHYSISVGLAQENVKKPDEPDVIAGVVYKPATGEVFHAQKGQGAFHNRKKLGRAKSVPLSRSMVATGTPYRSPDTADSFYACAREIVSTARDLRRFGSAALDLAWTAAGYFQVFYEVDLMPYDTAAGLLLLEECGVPFSTFSENHYRFMKDRTLLCGWPGAYAEAQKIISRHYSIS